VHGRGVALRLHPRHRFGEALPLADRIEQWIALDQIRHGKPVSSAAASLSRSGSFTDAYIAMEHKSLTPAEQQRVELLISGFNSADM